MSVSGPQAMRALDDALRDIRREEDEITKRISRANELVGKLRETELGQLRDLAAIRLAPDTQRELTGTLSRAEDKAREMLRSHAEAIAAMEKALAAREEALAGLASERQALLETATERQRQLDALSADVLAILAADNSYEQLAERLEHSEKMALEAERKADQAEADRAEKGAPYRNDPLFSYLWDRGYGTGAYRGSNLTRMLDGWVARLIGYGNARPNFAMLTAIPDRLRDHAQSLQADAEALEIEVAARETAALDDAGGKAAREELTKIQARVEEIDREIVALEDEREALAQEQKALADGDDPAYSEAIDVLSQAIRTTDVERLIADARATKTDEDDALVARLQETRQRIAEEQLELDDERARLKTLEARRRELEDIEFEFKKSRYDDPRSRFGDDKLVGDLLTDFLKGGMSASSYWGRWRDSQDWAGTSGPIVPQGRPSSRRGTGFSLPKGGFSPRPPKGGNWGGFSRPRSSGFGGGGFKSGGGFKGTGFKTGGGF